MILLALLALILTAHVLPRLWIQTNFLLSASIDKSVRLWYAKCSRVLHHSGFAVFASYIHRSLRTFPRRHVSRTRCLCMFQHSDFVTGVAFHPTVSKIPKLPGTTNPLPI